MEPVDLGEKDDRPLAGSDSHVPQEFDEIAYKEAYPDVAAAIKAGVWTSALHHYHVHGASENRLAHHRYIQAAAGGSTAWFPPSSVDRGFITTSGHCLLSGWVSDSDDTPLHQIMIRLDKKVVATTESIARQRRDDANSPETAIKPRLLGFWSHIQLANPADNENDYEVVLFAGPNRRSFILRFLTVTEEELRDVALRSLINAQYFGDAETETFFQLDKGLGLSLIKLNTQIVKRITSGAYRERFGPRRASYSASIIVVLYGDADFLTLQAALFSQCPGYDRYEYIYVSNSLELSDILIKSATTASTIYNISITLVLLPANAGFGAACNVGAAAAESDRIIFLNPDVLPRDNDWPQKHLDVVQHLPPSQTAIFGVPLFYADGSLMHGGMYTEIVGCCSVQAGHVHRRQILRVQHYGKGAPPQSPQYLRARPVTAITGAFMSFDRGWFEHLEGFSPEFIFGHYEDADLCLRSLQAGTPSWVHNISFWHLESKGSKHAPVHDGGRLVNRWNLSEKWGELVKAQLAGKWPVYFQGQGSRQWQENL